MIPSSRHLAVLLCCFYCSKAFANETHDCGIEYYTGTWVLNQVSTTYSDTILCNTFTMDMLDESDAIALIGDDDVYYDTTTNSYRFINNDISAQQFASATILINAAFQAAGIGIQFSGWKYEYKVYKSANTTLGFKMQIMDGNNQIYLRTVNFTGAHAGSSQSAEDTPPYLINITDTYTFVATMTGNTADDGIGDLQFSMVYKTVAGHESDFDANFIYPGQTTQLTFEQECEADSQYSPACYNYVPEVYDTGQDGGDDGSSTNPDQNVSSGLSMDIADDGSIIIEELPTIIITDDNMGIDEQISTGVNDGQPSNDGSDIFDDDIGLPPVDNIIIDQGVGIVTEDLMAIGDLPDTIDILGNLGNLGNDIEPTTGIAIEETVVDVIENSIEMLPELDPIVVEELSPLLVEELDTIQDVASPTKKLTTIQRNALTSAASVSSTAEQIASDSSSQSVNSDGVSGADGSTSSGSSTSTNNSTSGDSTGNQTQNSSNSGTFFNTNQTSLQQTDGGTELISGESDISLIASGGLSTGDMSSSSAYGNSTDFGFSIVSVESSLPLDIVAVLNLELNTLINNMTRDIIEESDELNEVSEEQMGMQQNLEDDLVEKALEGDTSEEAKAALLGYNPKIREYQQPQMPDGNYYKSKDIYSGQRNYDNPSQRFFTGASDETHKKMVREQYERN